MIALYAGSFHPPTLGHMDLIARGAQMFDALYVAVMVNAGKKYLISAEERVAWLSRAAAGFQNVKVLASDGLTCDLARKLGAGALLRGVRGISDLETEMQLAHANRLLTGIDTVFLPARAEHMCVSSSLVNDVARHGGDISRMVPPEIIDDIRRAIARDSKGV